MNSIVNRTEEIIKSEMIGALTDSKPMQIRFYKNMNIRGEACYTSRPPLGIFSVTYCKFFLKLFSRRDVTFAHVEAKKIKSLYPPRFFELRQQNR